MGVNLKNIMKNMTNTLCAVMTNDKRPSFSAENITSFRQLHTSLTFSSPRAEIDQKRPLKYHYTFTKSEDKYGDNSRHYGRGRVRFPA